MYASPPLVARIETSVMLPHTIKTLSPHNVHLNHRARGDKKTPPPPSNVFTHINLDELKILGKVGLRVVVRLESLLWVLLAREHGELLDVPVEDLGRGGRIGLVLRKRVHGVPQAVGLRD